MLLVQPKASRKAFAVAVILFVLVLPVCAQRYYRYTVNGKTVSGPTYEAALLVNDSLKLAQEGRTTQAVGKLRKALIWAPMMAEAHANLGILLARQGKTQEAAEELRKAIIDDRSQPQPLLNLAALYVSEGDLEEGLRIFDKYFKDFPGDPARKDVEAQRKLLAQEHQELSGASGKTGRSARESGDYLANAMGQGLSRRWAPARMPIKVLLTPGGDLMKGYRPEYEGILKGAFREWEKAAPGKVKFIFLPPERRLDADIVCRWTDDVKMLRSTAETGEANMRIEFGTVQSAEILLLLSDRSAFPLTANLIRLLCLHEIGHALGVIGHSANPEDIMFCMMPLADKEQHLSRRDARTLRLLYEKEPDWWSTMWDRLEILTHGGAFRLGAYAVFLVFLLSSALVAICSLASRSRKSTRKRRR
jgi:predicted Zn-dependent protease